MGSSSTEVVSHTFDFEGGRDVSVYVPADRAQAIVFAADGQLVVGWGEDLERHDLPPTMIVGVHRAADEMDRLHEYSLPLEPQRFTAHEAFFMHEVRAWTQTRFGVNLPAARTAVLGVSAGGELALALGLRYPEIFGAVFCASPGGGYRPPETLPAALPRTYLVAGTEEPFFRDNASRWAAALGEAGADVVMKERTGGHGDAFWRSELPLMAAWAFGR